MRHALFGLVVMAALVTAGCQNAQLVRVCGRCGCEDVAAPILADQPCGTRLVGGARPESQTSSETGRSEPAPPKTAFEQKLDDTPITLMVENQAFADVVKTLQIQTGLNVVIDPSIADEIGDQVVVALKVVGLKLSTVLNLLAVQAGDGVEWAAVDEVVVFRRPTE